MIKITRQRIVDELLEMAEPYDLDKLVSEGILKKSAGWYSGVPICELPANIRKNIDAFSSNGAFKVPKDGWKRAQAAYNRLFK